MMTTGGFGMWRLILISFALMGWGFYELSGGADYAPQDGSLQASGFTPFRAPDPGSADPARVRPAANTPEVARAALDLSELPRVNVSLPSIAAPEGVKPAFEKARIDTSATQAPRRDIRQIRAPVVNMRNGPGTGYNVLTKLRRGEEVVIVGDNGDGWLKLRAGNSGRVGWAAENLVTATAE